MASRPQFGFVLEYVDDVASARPFYTDVLGLEVDRESPVFIQFSDPAGVSFAIASDEALSGQREPEVYWVVDDAAALQAELAASAEISYPLTQQPFGRVFGVKDPAGQTQFFVEFARDRPSTLVSEAVES
jgi:catechol 2,3-dioxygenase-like lactoylglutathione lyase family enzyme